MAEATSALNEGELPADLWDAVSSITTEDHRAEVLARAGAETARLTAAVSLRENAAEQPALRARLDEVFRVHRAATRAPVHSATDPASPAVRSLTEASRRQRTNADRRAFLLHETLSSGARTFLEPDQAAPEARCLPGATPSESDARARRALREQAGVTKRKAFERFLGEVAYRALPFDDEEKAPHRDSVLSEVTEAAAASKNWSLSEAAGEASLLTNEIVDELVDEEAVLLAVSAACSDSATPLGVIVERAGSAIEARAVAAAAGAKIRAARVEEAIALTEATQGTDPELRALRARRVVASSAPCLLESFYVASQHALTESTGGEVRHEVVLSEAVAQYTLLETLSAMGVVKISDPAVFAAAIMRAATVAA